MKRGWFGRFLDAEADEHAEWYRQHPELNPNAHGYIIAPLLGVLSLSFSLGWAWKGLVGAAICVPFLGFPAAAVVGWQWGKAANAHRDDPVMLRRWFWSGVGVAVLAVLVFYRVFARG